MRGSYDTVNIAPGDLFTEATSDVRTLFWKEATLDEDTGRWLANCFPKLSRLCLAHISHTSYDGTERHFFIPFREYDYNIGGWL
jgi:hypothetical protein